MNAPAPLLNAWVRAVFVVAAIPALWAVELWVGLTVIRTPEVIYGEAFVGLFGFIPARAADVALALAVISIMYRTPFEVISLAFSSGRRPRTVEEAESSE